MNAARGSILGCAVALAAVIPGVTSGSGGITFGPAATTVVGLSPAGIATADLNGDGIADLVVADSASAPGTVSVLLGDGSGGFPTAAAFPAGTTPVAVAVADAAGNSNLDLVVSDATGSLRILQGNGTGSFTLLAPVAGVGTPGAIAAAIDSDGILDVAVVNSAGTTVSVLRRSGSGLGAATAFPVLTHASGLVLTDLNGDGHLDLAVTNDSSDSFTVSLGDGHGHFPSPVSTPLPGGSHPGAIAAGDLDGDGHPDLAIVETGVPRVAVWLGAGTGSFSSAGAPSSVGGAPTGIAVADFDGDGVLDLAVSESATHKVSVLAGDGSGSFSAAVPFDVGTGPAALVAIDFDGDGEPDIATANRTGNSVSALLNTTPFPAEDDRTDLSGYCMPTPVLRADGTYGQFVVLETDQPDYDDQWADAVPAANVPGLGWTCDLPWFNGFDPPPPDGPVNTVLPYFTGTAQVFRTLIAQPGTWTGDGVTFDYTWQLCDSSGNCADAGAGGFFRLLPAAAGDTVQLVVTATGADGGTTDAVSAQSAPVQR